MGTASTTIRIALVGDQSPDVKAHVAIPKALALAGAVLQINVTPVWFHTSTLIENAAVSLKDFHGVWCVPGSPYASMDGAMNAIRFARENNVPFLGTCGGSQHALIEYCRNVLHLTAADHVESNPQTDFALIAALPCALRETESRTRLVSGSRVQTIYGCDEVSEPFNCGFGLNPEFRQLLDNGPLKIAGEGEDGIARVFELEPHPFFIATLFQPERSAFNDVTHPLMTAFVKAAAA